MKRSLLCAGLVLLGCSGVEGPGAAGANGKDGASTLLILQRQDAAAGCNGGPGTVASSYVDEDGSGTVTTGDKLVSQAVVCDGTPGAAGKDGAPGASGASCTVQPVAADATGPAPNGGALITCGSTSTLVLNGAPGAQGAQGEPGTPAPPTAYSVVAVLDPCGPSGGADEVFLRLANGSLIASFSDTQAGQNTRLSTLGNGTFVTSDGTNCLFTLSTDTSSTPATRSIQWSGGGASWPVTP